MAKKGTREEIDMETGEVSEVERDLVSHEEVAEDLAELRARDTKKEFEWPDPRPMAPPLGYTPEIPLADRIRAMVRSEHLRMHAQAQGAESFEEADDFDVDDDFDPTSPYEMFFDPPVVSAEAKNVASPPEPQKPVSGEPQRGGGGAEPPSAKQTETP